MSFKFGQAQKASYRSLCVIWIVVFRQSDFPVISVRNKLLFSMLNATTFWTEKKIRNTGDCCCTWTDQHFMHHIAKRFQSDKPEMLSITKYKCMWLKSYLIKSWPSVNGVLLTRHCVLLVWFCPATVVCSIHVIPNCLVSNSKSFNISP